MTKSKGFTLIEVIVGVVIFLIVAISAWQAFHYILELVRVSKIKVAAIALSNEQLEIVRNLPYADVGIVDGLPPGKLIRNRTIVRDGIPFNAQFTVRNVDDPSDGLAPEDLSGADYKSVEIEISCPTCQNFLPLKVTTTAAPKNLEEASTNGALFIRTLNANGQPVAQANIHIINNNVSPPLDINEITDNNGWLKLFDAPPSVESYQIIASKAGYSTDQTYPPGDPGNPNPLKPHATVVLQQVTQITFVIDKVSALNILTVDDTCVHKGYIDFHLQGAKLIGANPNIYKYGADHQTNSNGQLTIPNLEWDSYSIDLTDNSYFLTGSIPVSPFALAPNSVLDLFLVVKQILPKAILVKIRDASTLLPLSGATVSMEKPGWDDQILESGRGYLRQTDWRGGPEQSDFINKTKYWSQDENVATKSELTLKKEGNKYKPSGWLISSTFDTGSASNFYNLIWQPLDQKNGTEVKFQIATSLINPPDSWDFLGPDGTSNTYYTVSDTNIDSIHNDDRYLRYKIFLSTANNSVTPTVSDIAITFSSNCIPPGQTFFYALPASGNWTLTISKDGYQTHSETVDINQDWQQKEITLSPSS